MEIAKRALIEIKLTERPFKKAIKRLVPTISLMLILKINKSLKNIQKIARQYVLLMVPG